MEIICEEEVLGLNPHSTKTSWRTKMLWKYETPKTVDVYVCKKKINAITEKIGSTTEKLNIFKICIACTFSVIWLWKKKSSLVWNQNRAKVFIDLGSIFAR